MRKDDIVTQWLYDNRSSLPVIKITNEIEGFLRWSNIKTYRFSTEPFVVYELGDELFCVVKE